MFRKFYSLSIPKFYSLIILLVLCLSLSACGGSGDTSSTENRETTAPAESGETALSSDPAEAGASTESDETAPTSDTTESGAPAETSATALSSDPADETASAEEASSVPVLMRTGSFTGTTPLETNNAYHGGYYYSEQTQDGQTIIVNCCFTSSWEGEDVEDYMASCAEQISEEEIRELTITENSDHTQRIGYPVHLLSWQTGQGEETRQWDAFFFMTDTHTYLYAFDTAASAAPEMQEIWLEVFGQLSLVDLTA